MTIQNFSPSFTPVSAMHLKFGIITIYLETSSAYETLGNFNVLTNINMVD